MRRTLIPALALLLLTPLSGSAQSISTLEQIAKTGTIRLGYRKAQPPMSFSDLTGVVGGYSIDLCERIVTGVKSKLNRSDIKIEYVPVTAKTRFQALIDNRIDIHCGSTTQTLSRRQLVDFTQLTFVTGASLMSLKTNPVRGLADLQGKKVAVSRDTTTIEALDKALSETLTDTEVVPVDSTEAGYRALAEGKVDAYASDQVVLIGLAMSSGKLDELFISEELFSFEPFALPVRRNDSDFRLVADEVLSQLYRSGQVGALYKKWFGQFSKSVPEAIQAMYMINSTPK